MILLFSATLWLAAFLLFLVQPMIGKMVLPLLGGTPAVWNTCMVFFQTALLAGYAYAHALNGPIRRHNAAVHLALLALGASFLPIGLAAGVTPPTSDNPTGWLLATLAVAVGVPFIVLSATAPLLQSWFARSGHTRANDPYFLYAASNVGSLAALLAYPLVVERLFTLEQQGRAWAWAYACLIALTLVCGVLSRRRVARTMGEAEDTASLDGGMTICANRGGPTNSAAVGTYSPDCRPLPGAGLREGLSASGLVNWAQRSRWVLLAAVPASLMLGVTTHITTDVAAVPLLWVLPLALYLLTFILVFARRQLIPQRRVLQVLPFVLLAFGPLLFMGISGWPGWTIAGHLALFFVTALACHGQLAALRPEASRLTEFYMWMSIGGAVGGFFNALLAPNLFTAIVEYPLALVAACLLLPTLRAAKSRRLAQLMDIGVPAVFVMLAMVVVLALRMSGVRQSPGMFLAVYGIPALVCFAFKDRPVRFGLCFAGVLLVAAGYNGLAGQRVEHVERNFFGVKRVMRDEAATTRQLVHGNTNHGAQRIKGEGPPEPLAYYHRGGPFAALFASLPDVEELAPAAHRDKTPGRSSTPIHNGGEVAGQTARAVEVGIIGLGVGSLAAYSHPGRRLTFYEIDPAVERLARDTALFRFLAEARGPCRVVLGDGRLKLKDAPDGCYDMLVLDAFSSDAVPTHLLSREAVELYFSKLRPAGIVAFHISNRYLDFEPMLANMAAELSVACVVRRDPPIADDVAAGIVGPHVLAMSRSQEALAGLQTDARWRPPQRRADVRIWTDQYCDLWGLRPR